MNERKRFNAIDVLIILCVALIVLSVVFRGHIINFFSDQENLTEYTVEFISEPTKNEVAAAIVNGASLTWTEYDCLLGSITELSTEKASIHSLDSSGVLHTSLSETESTVNGKIKVFAANNAGCYVSGSHFLAAGMQITLKTDKAQFTVTVTSVTQAK